MNKIKNYSKQLLLCLFILFLYSCSRPEIIDDQGAISSELKNDPLFEAMDKAYSIHFADIIKYPKNQIDPLKQQKFKEDLKANKFKTLNDYTKAKERTGYIDFEKRSANMIAFKRAEAKLYNKYPELKQEKTKFYAFFLKNRNYKLLDEETKKLLIERKKIIENNQLK